MYAKAWWVGISWCAGIAAALAMCLTACGRGPVETINVPVTPSITLELFVAGTIQPSEGDYIIALNTNILTAPNTFQNVFSSFGEKPGEPTIVEAYGSNPAPFTHWDQVFGYGPNINGIPGCFPGQQNNGYPYGFSYCYKAIRSVGGQNQVNFVQYILSPNDVTFNPSGSSGSGSGNAMIVTLPINCLSINSTQPNTTCGSSNPTVNQNVVQVYVNLVTLDNNGVAQDQLACLAGQSVTVDVRFNNTIPLLKPTSCATTPPSNQDLVITGGLVVTNTGTSASPSPSPSSSPSPSPSPT